MLITTFISARTPAISGYVERAYSAGNLPYEAGAKAFCEVQHRVKHFTEYAAPGNPLLQPATARRREPSSGGRQRICDRDAAVWRSALEQ